MWIILRFFVYLSNVAASNDIQYMNLIGYTKFLLSIANQLSLTEFIFNASQLAALSSTYHSKSNKLILQNTDSHFLVMTWKKVSSIQICDSVSPCWLILDEKSKYQKSNQLSSNRVIFAFYFIFSKFCVIFYAILMQLL